MFLEKRSARPISSREAAMRAEGVSWGRTTRTVSL
jgi:hypothetical protein